MAALTQALVLVRRYHRAWTGGDFAGACRCLAPDLEMDVPINTYRTTRQWMAAVARTRQMAERVDLLAELGSEAEAVLLYDMVLGPPIGTLRIAEHFTVTGGRITRIRHVHDTYQLRLAEQARQEPEPAPGTEHPS